MTIKDIARLAGCSTATISRVINNEKGVSDEKREYIRKIIQENNYVPSAVAKNLAVQRANTLLFVYENAPGNPFYSDLIHGTLEAAREAHQMLLFNILTDEQVTDYFISALSGNMMDGVIVASTGNAATRAFVKAVSEAGQKIILLNDPIEELRVPCIYIDNELSGYQATEHLISRGHKRIGHVGGRMRSRTASSRYAGYKRAMMVHDLEEYVDRYTIMNNTTPEEAYNSAKQILSQVNRPTAIFAANDNMAMGVYQAARELKLRIPEDLSVVGHDDIGMASRMNPKLTTMHQPLFEISKQAVSILLKMIDSGNGEETQVSIVLAAELVDRESVKSLNEE